jgi:hypothetical protein
MTLDDRAVLLVQQNAQDGEIVLLVVDGVLGPRPARATPASRCPRGARAPRAIHDRERTVTARIMSSA